MGPRGTALVVLVLGGGLGGCFGDWVSARPRPQRGAADQASGTLDAGAPAPADPCGGYLRAVAERCNAILDGQWSTPGCHPDIVRVMTLYRSEGDEPLAHGPRSTGRRPGVSIDDTRALRCAQQWNALPPTESRAAKGHELGPQCRAWAQVVRERCVAPLASIPPDLHRCGAELPAFEGTLGAITFGRPQAYEDHCRDAVVRLRQGDPG